MLLINGACFLGEMAAYGTWYAEGEPARLYDRSEGHLPTLRSGVHLPGLLHDVRINAQGFRGPELQSPKPESRVRLWCLGGSTTFDLYARDDSGTWPELLAGRLDEALTREVDVVNAGVPGQTLLGGLDQLKSTDLEPDVLLIYTGPNELAQQRMWAPTGWTIPLPDYAAVRVARRILPLGPATPPEYRDEVLGTRALAQLRQELLHVTEPGLPVVFITHAIWAQPEDTGEVARERVGVTSRLLRLTPEQTIAAMDAYNQMVREVAVELDAPLVDLRAAIDGDPRWWGDSVHFSAEGSERAAEFLAEALEPLDLRPLARPQANHPGAHPPPHALPVAPKGQPRQAPPGRHPQGP